MTLKKSGNGTLGHLGFNTDQYGTSFEARKADKPEEKSFSVWSTFGNYTTYFARSGKDIMINLLVENPQWLLRGPKKRKNLADMRDADL